MNQDPSNRTELRNKLALVVACGALTIATLSGCHTAADVDGSGIPAKTTQTEVSHGPPTTSDELPPRHDPYTTPDGTILQP